MSVFFRAVLLVAVTIIAAGCGSQDDRKPMFPISGRLTFKGEPMTGARVGFHPLNDPDPRAVRATGTAGEDGRFALTTYLTGDGAPAGEYAVTIYWPGKRPKGQALEPGEDAEMPPDRLNRAYADPKTVKLRATVRAEPNAIEFNLP